MNGWWTVILEAYTFETENEANAFAEALEDAFTNIPQAAGCAASTRVTFESDDE